MALTFRFLSNERSQRSADPSNPLVLPPKRGMTVLPALLAIVTVAMAAYATVALLLARSNGVDDTSLAPATAVAGLGVAIAGICAAIVVVMWRKQQRWQRQIGQIVRGERPFEDDAMIAGATATPIDHGLRRLQRRLRDLQLLNEQLGSMLLDRDQQLASIRGLAGALYWETDRAGRYCRLDTTGAAPRSTLLRLLGKHRWDDDAQIAGGSARDWPALRDRLSRQQRFDDLVVRRRDHDGEWFELWEAGEPRFTSDGQFAGYRGVMLDLDLSPVTSPLRSDTAAQLLALQASTRELESFSYTVSHDLRAPLRTVDGFARIVQEDYRDALDHTAHEHLGRILGATQRMNAMIDALLTLARLSAQPVDSVDVDLSRLAGEVIEELRAHERLDDGATAAGRARQLSVKISPGLHDRGDPLLLRLVLQNLLGNGWKYSSRRPHATIAFSREKHGRLSVYCVADNGVGFDMRHANRLFGAFQRLHTASEFPGTGVGLATVQRIVRQHHGRLWAYAEPDRGATFYFTLWERHRPSLH